MVKIWVTLVSKMFVHILKFYNVSYILDTLYIC